MNKLMYKKLLIVIACLTFGSNLNAQISVSSFEEAPADRDAVLFPYKQDGETWALIKINTGLRCADFKNVDAGQAGKGELDCKDEDGHKWLYLPPKAVLLNIGHEAGNIDNYSIPPLKAGTVYLMTISGLQKVITGDLVDQQYFTVRCTIPNATIQFDDNKEEFPFVNGVHRLSLKYGKHIYVVRAPNYHEDRAPVTITATKLPDVTITLKPKFGTLIINTNPTGADIVITGTGGKPITAKSPYEDKEMPSGDYEVEVKKLPMYGSVKQKVTVKDGETTRTVPPIIELPRHFAKVTLISEEGGAIFVDDEYKGDGKWEGDLPAKDYRVTVKKKSHREREQPLTVTAGKDMKVTLPKLEPMFGILDIVIPNSAIGSAKVYIDGVAYSETAPNSNIRIPTEGHTIKLVPDHAEYLDFEQTVEIKEGKVTKLDAIFPEKEKFARLRISSSPTNAAVKIDGTDVGLTPVTKENLPLRPTTVVFERKGYKPLEKTVKLVAGDNEIHEVMKVKQKPKPFMEFEFWELNGLTFGVYNRWGLYISARFPKAQSGKIVSEASLSKVNFDEREYKITMFAGGGIVRLANWCSVYGGLGQGEYGTIYPIADSKDYYSTDMKKGLVAEGGVRLSLGSQDLGLTLSAGYCSFLSGNPHYFSGVKVGAGFYVGMNWD
ncbi:hypothetical protein FACS1894195_2360 [Bacteroidia bacterium]|nr:hypothetical protein FACS1894195_2360 [Bacteroidia bacterium]